MVGSNLFDLVVDSVVGSWVGMAMMESVVVDLLVGNVVGSVGSNSDKTAICCLISLALALTILSNLRSCCLVRQFLDLLLLGFALS